MTSGPGDLPLRRGPLRTLMKLSAFSLLALTSAAFAAPIRVLLPAEPSPAAAERTTSLKVTGVDLTTTADPPTAAQLSGTDVLVLFNTQPTPLPDGASAAIEKFTQRGGGLVILGGGIGAGDWLKPLAGGTWSAGSRKFANKLMFYPVTDAHPVTQNASAFDIDDETSYDLDLEPAFLHERQAEGRARRRREKDTSS